MATTKKHIGEQLKRLMGKPFAPTGPTAEAVLGEIVSTVAEVAESDDHVTRLVSVIARMPGDFPEPAAFRQAAQNTRTHGLQPDPHCAACGGCGYAAEPRVYRHGGQTVRTVGSRRCDCWAVRPLNSVPWAVSA
jgi:hypothetical protein